MVAKNNSSEFSGITPEDYRSLIKIKRRNLFIIFVVIVAIIGISLAGFQYIQRRNSNLKVEEARVMIDRGDTVESSPTPETLELEEMVAETEEDVNWLVEQLVADSFVVNLNDKLEERYRQHMYYSPHERLPSGWRDNLPAQLEQWRNERISHRRAEVNYLLEELEDFLSNQRRRLQRAEEIRVSLDEEAKMPPVEYRFKQAREQLLELLYTVETEVENSAVDNPQIPASLFRLLAELVDPLSKITLQYRRVSGLTSAPAAYLYAEQYLQDALRIDPWNPEAFYQLGRVYERMGKEIVSSEYYLRMIKEAPSYRRVEDLIDRFERVVKNNPGSARAHYDLGFAYYEVGRHQDSLASLLKVLEDECNVGNLDFIIESYEQGKYSVARQLVDDLIVRSGCESESMTLVLAQLRIGYILEGEPPYHKMAYH